MMSCGQIREHWGTSIWQNARSRQTKPDLAWLPCCHGGGSHEASCSRPPISPGTTSQVRTPRLAAGVRDAGRSPRLCSWSSPGSRIPPRLCPWDSAGSQILPRRGRLSPRAAQEIPAPSEAGLDMPAGTVLILGGSGRIGSSVAADIIANTGANVIITGRSASGGEDALRRLGSDRVSFLALDLSDDSGIRKALAQLKGAGPSLVVHCAGPFHNRDDSVLRSCIDSGVDYVDVSDAKAYTVRALELAEAAREAGVTAVINTGIFPGISNSMVREGVEQIDEAEDVQLNYVVAGSGGAGLTVMRTTFLGLQHPFQAWLGGKWTTVHPYTEREAVDLPAPYGRAYVYWYEMPETFTLADSFPVKSVVTKFGSVPDVYNHLTWMTANVFPKIVIQSDVTIELLSRISKAMTDVTDQFSGVWVAMQCEVKGSKGGQKGYFQSTIVHPNTAVACGAGTGTIAQLILEKKLVNPGVSPVERVLTTQQFKEAMARRDIHFQHSWTPS